MMPTDTRDLTNLVSKHFLQPAPAFMTSWSMSLRVASIWLVGVRPIRTGLRYDSDIVAYPAQRLRHSLRATVRLALKSGPVRRLRSWLKWLETEAAPNRTSADFGTILNFVLWRANCTVPDD